MSMPFRSRRWRHKMRRRVRMVCLWVFVVLFLNVLGWVVASRLVGSL